jgi:ferritin-like metal-binding protein YciE
MPSSRKETSKIKSMDLLIHGLQDVYYGEQQIIKSLAKTIEKATTSPD